MMLVADKIGTSQEIDQQVEQTKSVKPKEKRRSKNWGEVRVFGRWCKGCGLCIAFCPSGVFEADYDGPPRVRFPERCTGCEWCEFHCPDLAIEVIRHTTPRESDKS